MNLSLRFLATSVLLVSGAACASISLPDVGGRESPDLARKMVVAKKDSQTLVASDGTRCIPGESKFERVQVGDRVWCVWESGGTRSAAALGG